MRTEARMKPHDYSLILRDERGGIKNGIGARGDQEAKVKKKNKLTSVDVQLKNGEADRLWVAGIEVRQILLNNGGVHL